LLASGREKREKRSRKEGNEKDAREFFSYPTAGLLARRLIVKFSRKKNIMASMNKKQISCLVAGLSCTIALIAFCIWAGVGGFFDKFSHSSNKNVSLIDMLLVSSF
jgi:hypothetical protein